MRRTAPVAIVIAVVLAILGVFLAERVSHPAGYRVAAVFDNAKGIVAGQDVKIAGAVVGTVSGVALAPGPKALITMTVDRRFAPFRADATCSILPNGLISENYVECDPGHTAAQLRTVHGIATVPLGQTTLPMSLADVLRVLSVPTDQRLRILISELGIATSGRGQDLGGVLARAAPTLVQVRGVLKLVDSDRRLLADALSQTEAVLARLAARSNRTRAFVDTAAEVAATTAAHRAGLRETIAELPRLLDAADPALAALDRAASDATPLLIDLHAGAPALTRLTAVVPAFAASGIPALRSLSAAAAVGRWAVQAAVPVVGRLARAAKPLGNVAMNLYHLLVSTRDRGGFEGLLRVPYGVAAATALYDGVSHLVTLVVNASPRCIAAQQAATDAPGCSHRYGAPGGGAVPVNDPRCGPVDAAWFDARCPTPPPSPAVGTNARKLASLLRYLVR